MREIEQLLARFSERKVFSLKEIKTTLAPLFDEILSRHRKGKTKIIGIQGGQGTGKTTVAELFTKCLQYLQYEVQYFSIEDFYKTYQERQKIRTKFKGNPYYEISRGMPGTHRVKELKKTLGLIRKGKPFTLPVFDKSLHHAQGDVSRKTIKVNKKQDFVFFEGWCVGIPPVSSKEFLEISKKNDIDLVRMDQNLNSHKAILKEIQKYKPLWKNLDYLVMLQPISSDLHKRWRYKQERKLKERKGRGMSNKEIKHFVEPFLPFTYVCYEKIHPDARIMIKGNQVYFKLIK